MRSSLPLVLAALAAAALTSGCTRPAVALKPPAFQQEAYAVRDWQHVARHIAMDMERDGFLPDPARPHVRYAHLPYFVDVVTPRSQFLHEVAASLESAILAHGGQVARTPVGAAVIDLSVDVVRWPSPPPAFEGFGTVAGLASGTGVLVAGAGPITPVGGFGLLAGAGIASDLLRVMSPNTDTEVAWGAKIALGNRIVFDVRYPMYIGHYDTNLYESPPPPPPPQVVQLRYAR